MRTNGFSLIELLVVIAIIAILAAMVMPAISSVRFASTKATFASNQRQIGMAFLSYVPDHNGWTIWGAGPGATSVEQWQAMWFCVLARDYLEQPIPNNLTHTDVMRSIFHDPIDLTKTDYVGYQNRAVFNLAIVGRTGLSVRMGASNRRLTSFRHISEQAMLVPGPSSTVAPYPYVPVGATEWGYSNRYHPWGWINGGPSLFMRYRGTGPCTFLDGRVESVDSATFWAELPKDRYGNPAIPSTCSRMFDSCAINP